MQGEVSREYRAAQDHDIQNIYPETDIDLLSLT